jgi:hypothetical protein
MVLFQQVAWTLRQRLQVDLARTGAAKIDAADGTLPQLDAAAPHGAVAALIVSW